VGLVVTRCQGVPGELGASGVTAEALRFRRSGTTGTDSPVNLCIHVYIYIHTHPRIKVYNVDLD